MSTHIPADHFTKPILARLGVGKGPGGKGIDSGARSRAFCGAIAPTWDRIEMVLGYVKIEQEQERLDRVRKMMIAANVPQHPYSAWPKWQTDNAEKCRRRVVLYLPRIPDDRGKDICPDCGRVTGGEDDFRPPEDVCRCRPVLPDFGAIDCPKCLAAWDAFAADTGATVEVIPTPAEQGDDEPWGAGAADRGGRW